MIGIYKITNKINNKSYIGQSINIESRWIHHRNYPIKYSRYPLYLAFEKYGIENFNFEVIEECSCGELDEKEQYYISKYDTYNNGYNQTLGGSSGSYGNSIKLSKEDVWTIYDLLQFSSISQREIAQQFHVGEDTISEINQGKTRVLPNFSFPLRSNIRQKYYCQRCGKEISRSSTRTYCRECYRFFTRKVERPSREELKKLIKNNSFTQLSRDFQVSDNAIRKWCKAYNLPSSKSEIGKYSIEEWEKI